MKPQINYKEHCKIRIRNFDPAFDKHELTKLVLMILSKRKHKNVGIYSELPLPNGDIPDIVIDFGDSLILYEIQKEITNQWLDRIKQRDQELPSALLKKVDTIIIPLKKLSDNIPELTNQLGGYLV